MSKDNNSNPSEMDSDALMRLYKLMKNKNDREKERRKEQRRKRKESGNMNNSSSVRECVRCGRPRSTNDGGAPICDSCGNP